MQWMTETVSGDRETQRERQTHVLNIQNLLRTQRYSTAHTDKRQKQNEAASSVEPSQGSCFS